MNELALGDFQDWPFAALFVDAQTGVVTALTAGAAALSDQVGITLVGVPLERVFGADTAARLSSSKEPLAVRIIGDDGRTLCFLARPAPTAAGNGRVVLLEDVTQLWLGEATALAMAGVTRARVETNEARDYAQQCAEVLVVAGLAKKTAILVWREEQVDFSVYGALGWSRDELPRVVAAARASFLEADSVPAEKARSSGSSTDWAQLGEFATTGFVELTHDGQFLGLLVVAPFANWQAAPGSHLLSRAVSEGLAALLYRRPVSIFSGVNDDPCAVAAKCINNIVDAFSCPGHGISARERCEKILETVRVLVPFEKAAVLADTGDNGGFKAQFVYPADARILTDSTTIAPSDATFYSAAAGGHPASGRLSPEQTGPISTSLRHAGIGPWALVPLEATPDADRALLAVRGIEATDFTPGELSLLRVAAILLSRQLASNQARAARGQADRRTIAYDRAALSQIRMEAAGAATSFFTTHLRAAEAAVQQALELCREGAARESMTRALETLGSCLSEADRINACRDALPDEALEPVSLAQIVRQAVHAVTESTHGSERAWFPAYHIRTEITTKGYTLGQPDRLQEAVRALLDNALQAMPHGGRLTVSLDSCGSWVRLLVTDTGVGIAPSLWDAVFQPFFTTLGVRHAGLGLTFVDSTVAKHKGVALICSDVCEGTTIAVYLPAVSEPLEAAPEP